MLQILGDKLKGMVTWTIVLLIAVVFVFLGLNDYFSFSEQSVIAKVNGQKIMRKTVDTLYERFAAQNNTLDAEALKKQVIHMLIRGAALLSEAQALGFETSDEQVVEILLKIPAFQVDGEFSKDHYQKVLAQMAYTDASFRKELAENACLGQFEQGIVQSSFSTPQALQRIVALVEQKRDVGYLQLPAHHYRKTTSINEQEITDFYEKNKQKFISPEAVSLEYVRLSLEPFIKKMVLSAEEVSDYYKEHQSDYTLPERVHARHLLISVPAGQVDPKVEKEAVDRVEGLLKQLKGGADFSALAKRWSDDHGSAKKGGDLGWMTRGQMVPSFEEAAFHLKPGAYSEAIRTDFGYHIIQVVAHKHSEVRPLAAVAPAITEQLTFQRAQAQFEKTKETLEKLALEQQDTSTLLPIATALELPVEQTALFSMAGGGEGVIADPMVQKVAFSEAFIKQGFSVHPVLLSDQSILVMRLKQHHSARQQTLAEAQKTVREQVLHEKMQSRLQAFSDSFVKRVQGGENPAVLAKEQGLVWHTKKNVARQEGLQNEILSAGFQLSPLEPGEKLKIGKFVFHDGSYGLLVLYKVVPGQWSGLEASAQQAYNRSLTDISGRMDYTATVSHVVGSSTIQWLDGSASQ